MKVGVHLPQWGPGADAHGVRDVVQAVEECGLDSVWVADHLAVPLKFDSPYPYHPQGPPFRHEDGFLEALTTLAVAAGATRRVQLGTSVLVLPLREPLTTAKSIATLDILAEGRTLIAIGVGWLKEEFEALGQRFEARGRRVNEQIDILRAAWSNGSVEADGEFFRFSPVVSRPLPAQAGGPRLLIGGMGPAALRRAATRGDGWHAAGGDVSALRNGRRQLDAMAEAAGRDPRDISMSTSTAVSRHPERAMSRLRGLLAAGVDHVVLTIPGGPQAVIEQIETITGALLPELQLATQQGPTSNAPGTSMAPAPSVRPNDGSPRESDAHGECGGGCGDHPLGLGRT